LEGWCEPISLRVKVGQFTENNTMRMNSANQALAIALALMLLLTVLLSLAGCAPSFRGGVVPISSSCGNNCPPSPEFLYATSTDHILAFTIDQSTGALGAPLAMTGPNQSLGMVASVTLGHLYVSDFLNDAVDGFSINSSSGGLTAIPGSPLPLGGTPPGAGGLSNVLPGNFYLYATDLNAGTVAGFTFDSASGKLTPVPGSPFLAGNTPVQAARDYLGKFLYISNLNDSAGGISAFTIDQNTGALSPIPGSPFPTGSAGSFPGPSAMVVNNNFLYVALAGTANPNNKIVAFAIDPTTGVLTTVPGSPFTTGSDPLYMALVPVTTVGFQAVLYTANVQDGTISAFTADDNTGVLAPVNGFPYASGTSVEGLTVAPYTTSNGIFFLYASDPQAKTVRAYTIDGNTGALSPIPGSPFPAGNAPMLLTVAQGP
jgi:6-phosphogluconolactonase (cycloisomerase 2 family)